MIREESGRMCNKSLRELLCYFFLTLQPSAGYGLPVTRGFLITHNDALQSVEPFWTSDQLVAETSTWQHHTQQTNTHALRWIRTNNRSRRAAEVLCIRPRHQWARRTTVLYSSNVTLQSHSAAGYSGNHATIKPRHHPTTPPSNQATHMPSSYSCSTDMRTQQHAAAS
jgi:hypothetical protein